MWQHLIQKNHPRPEESLELYRQAIDLGLHGNWTEAEELLEKSLEPLELAEAPEAAAANHNLAALLQERAELDGAVFHAVRAVFLYNRLQDLGGLYSALRNLSVIHTSRGESHLAMAAHHQAARARRELVARGLLGEAADGRDSQGEKLRMLGISAAQLRPAEAM